MGISLIVGLVVFAVLLLFFLYYFVVIRRHRVLERFESIKAIEAWIQSNIADIKLKPRDEKSYGEMSEFYSDQEQEFSMENPNSSTRMSHVTWLGDEHKF